MHRVHFELEDHHHDALRAIAGATGRSPSGTAHDWVVERLLTYSPALLGPDDLSTVAPESEVERLRQHYRPDDVFVLVVGESAPAGGTFFYLANSNLFDATREAFERALGPMPTGAAFLDRFREMGFWLYDMVDKPVNRGRGRPRQDAVSAGVSALADQIREFEPDFVVGIKTSLEGPIKAAASRAEFPAHRILILPFPLYQWREEFIAGFGRFLGLDAGSTPPTTKAPKDSQMTLHEAMAVVLRDLGGGPVPARQVANEVALRGLYVRKDGSRADYQQLLLRARNYPKLFVVEATGIRLARGRA